MGVRSALYVVVRGLVVAGAWLLVAWQFAGPRSDDAGGLYVLVPLVGLLSLAWGVVDGVLAGRPGGADGLLAIATRWFGSVVVAALVVATFAPTPDASLDLAGIVNAGGFAALLLPLCLVPAVLGGGLGIGAHSAVRRLLSPGSG
ncbi:hypothetical protein [Nocardioides iriomotensis]|uniref:Uncharacterized protein n=1 Tax=Nocardioides iriomotensis TaxID=715784 RepID=A0A4V1Z1P1_9ACTN|nr:hypothetical protein [Nocardioides iriomotensis]RYU11586.1 hypothetical protein ETU37_13565 [Nocardioides iriomotensis]